MSKGSSDKFLNNSIMENLYLAQLLVTGMMTGVIWHVQLVNYPLFCDLLKISEEEEGFRAFHDRYTYRISFVVIPLMFSELFLSLYTLYKIPKPSSLFLFFPVMFCWLSTFFISVPLHQSLNKKPNLKDAEKLVFTNWVRTCFWSMRTVGLLTLIV